MLSSQARSLTVRGIDWLAGDRVPQRAGEAAIALAWPLLAMWVLERYQAGMMASIAMFLIVPAVLVAVGRPRIILPALAFSLAIGAPSIVWIDELGSRGGQWAIVDPLSLELPLIGASVQSLSWAVAHFFSSIVAWEKIKGPTSIPRPSLPRIGLCVTWAWGLLAAFLVVKTWFPHWLLVPYFYCWFGVVLILAPVIVTCLAKPCLVRPLAILAVLGLVWKTAYEIAALRNEWWRFPGEFVGWVAPFGYRIPIEELVFWIVLFSPAIAVFWEFCNRPARYGSSRSTSSEKANAVPAHPLAR